MLQGLAGFGDPTGRHGPVPPRSPGRDVLGVAPQDRLEPSCRLVERTLTDRQVGFPQPDPLIIRGEPLGAIQEVPDRLGRRHPHAQDDVQPDQLDRLVGAAPTRLVQSLPVGLDQPPRLLGPPLLPVERCQVSAQFVPVDPGIAQGFREELLGLGELSAIDQDRGPAHDRRRREPRIRGNPGPGLLGGFGPASCLLAQTQQVAGLIGTGLPVQQRGQVPRGDPVPAGLDLFPDLDQGRPIAPGPQQPPTPIGQPSGDDGQHQYQSPLSWSLSH